MHVTWWMPSSRISPPNTVEWTHGRNALLPGEQVAEEEGHADVPGEERVAPLPGHLPLPLDLRDRVPGERARPLEPALVARAPVQDEEGVGVTGRAVAQARALRQRPGSPGQLAAGERELQLELVAQRGHHPGRAVTPLHADLAGRRSLGGQPVDERARPERVRGEIGGRGWLAPVGERAHDARVAVRRAEEARRPPVQALRPEAIRVAGREHAL